MKNYRVVVHFDGACDYCVSAKNEDEAKEEAERLFSMETAESIAENICDVDVCDCEEE